MGHTKGKVDENKKCPYGYAIVSNFVHKEVECGLKAEHLRQIRKLKDDKRDLLAACNDVANLACIFMVIHSLNEGDGRAKGLAIVLKGLQRQCKEAIAKAESGAK